MVKLVEKKNPLEEALSKLDLQGTLVLLNILSTRALGLQQDEARKAKVQQLINPVSSMDTTALKLKE